MLGKDSCIKAINTQDMMSSKFISSLILVLLLSLTLLILPSICHASKPAPSSSPAGQVAPSKNTLFLYVNQGDFEKEPGEFNSYFRRVGIDSSNFSLCFYRSTPNAFTLAIGMGSPPKWVWTANRNDPVREGATLSLGKDGNLILADIDGRVVWQANTTNKGGVGLKMQESGNFVLNDANDTAVWQSFDYPSDTLLTGQSLKAGVTTKLVSRASVENNFEGNYSLEMSPQNVVLYYRSQNNPNPLPYYVVDQTFGSPSKEFSFKSSISNFFYHMTYQYIEYITTTWMSSSNQMLAYTWYNSTLSFLRLDYDGVLRTYTLDPMNRPGVWKVEYTLFKGEPLVANNKGATECQLPEKCGKFGVCFEDMCVACPAPGKLKGWSESCAPPKLMGCGRGKNVKYFKVEGVDHFSTMYTDGEGPMTESQCKTKCNKDCKCAGYFFHSESARCWIVYDLMTLSQSPNSTHFGYVKLSN